MGSRRIFSFVLSSLKSSSPFALGRSSTFTNDLSHVKPLSGLSWTCSSFRQYSFKTTGLPRPGVSSNLSSVLKRSNLVPGNALRSVASSISKKRTKRKAVHQLTAADESEAHPNLVQDVFTFPVLAYATCEELDLERLEQGLKEEGLYIPTEWDEDLNLEDVVHATAKYVTSDETREVFFFRDGAVVFWNFPDTERATVLNNIKPYQEQSYKDAEVMAESEFMNYSNVEDTNTRLTNKGKIILNGLRDSKLDLILEKYTFSNAMALSVKLGIWESTLSKFVEGIEDVTDELKHGKKIRLSRQQVLQKAGELFALRHELNLNSDLLDTPDFYWERDRLEVLYSKTINYLSISRRTTVMNEKLNQCFELLELILSHLNDIHHVRLEWLIILLIMIEVCFEIWHAVDRF